MRVVHTSALAALLLLSPARLVRANGAFPDSQGILLPSSRPQQIFLSTNFGLLRSDDGGERWGWICEEAVGPSAYLYQVGAAPDHRLFAVTTEGVVVSDDDGCTFQKAEGLLNPSDVFPDPNDPLRVLAVAQAPPSEEGSTLRAIFGSRDGGKHFSLEYTAARGVFIAGVESARSDADLIYLATSIYEERMWRPALARSEDGGQSYESHELLPLLGPTVPYLIAVDPSDTDRLYLRLQSGEQEQLAILDQPGTLAAPLLELGARMTAFLLRSDGAMITGNERGATFISTDGGLSFQSWKESLQLRALGEREGLVYVAADDQRDGFALAVSSDGGETLQPLLRFADITGPLDCGDLPVTCAEPFRNLMATLATPAGQEPEPQLGGEPLEPEAPMSPHASSGCETALGQPPTLTHAVWLAALLVGYRLTSWRGRRARRAR